MASYLCNPFTHWAQRRGADTANSPRHFWRAGASGWIAGFLATGSATGVDDVPPDLWKALARSPEACKKLWTFFQRRWGEKRYLSCVAYINHRTVTSEGRR
eukprot:5629558-Pyramimonas_sp.AAC.1